MLRLLLLNVGSFMICLSYFEIFLKKLNKSAKKFQNTFGLKNDLRGSTKLISYLLDLKSTHLFSNYMNKYQVCCKPEIYLEFFDIV